jgi:hypothetical protein
MKEQGTVVERSKPVPRSPHQSITCPTPLNGPREAPAQIERRARGEISKQMQEVVSSAPRIQTCPAVRPCLPATRTCVLRRDLAFGGSAGVHHAGRARCHGMAAAKAKRTIQYSGAPRNGKPILVFRWA